MDSLFFGTCAFLFRLFVAQPFNIPATSMAPTLEVGDYVWASKFSYGYSNYSLPYGERLPVFTFARSGPTRGDVVIFRFPSHPSIDYVKRIIGLPGDTVQVKAGITYLNGEPLKRSLSGTYKVSMGSNTMTLTGQRYIETLPGGRSYAIVELGESMGDDTDAFLVPEGHFFVMGDNRDNSSDSRFAVGFVPNANLVAKVLVAITWPDGKFTMRPVK